MTSTRSPSRLGAPSPNGNGIPPKASVRPPGRRVRVPEVAVGLLVTIVFALGAVLWHLNTVEKVPALSTVTRVTRGDIIDPADIRVIYVSSDESLTRLDSTQLDRVIGHVALVDLAKGTLLTSSVVADAETIKSGDGVVGLSLDPGAYPARGLAPGDRVNVVRAADVADLDAEPSVIARDATVFAIEELTSDRLLVSVLTGQDAAELVASSAGAGGLRLVLVAP
ncbi:MAG: hypothetical protein KDB26_09755 [Microthrixaceae bacterium]|nr:hypothetical protein [Microthrixaceae bacterium]